MLPSNRRRRLAGMLALLIDFNTFVKKNEDKGWSQDQMINAYLESDEGQALSNAVLDRNADNADILKSVLFGGGVE